MKDHQQSCKEMLETISDYVDGSLDESLCTELERHLRECENCQVVVNTLRKTIDLVHKNAEGGEVPNEVRDRLFHRLELDPFIHKDQASGG